MSDDDWENFAENDDYNPVIKKEGTFNDEQQIKVQEEAKEEPKTNNNQKNNKKEPKGKKNLQKKEDDDEDLFGDKKAFKLRNEILAKKANQNDVAKLFEDEIDSDLKKAVENVKIEEIEQYGQVGYLMAKEFLNEDEHTMVGVQQFIEDFFDKISERFQAKDLQTVNKKLSAKIQEKQKEEKAAQKKGGKKGAPAAQVKVMSSKMAAQLESDSQSEASDNEAYGDDDFM